MGAARSTLAATVARLARADLLYVRLQRGPIARASLLFDLASTLAVTRPRGWQERSARAYRAVIRRLTPVGASAADNFAPMAGIDRSPRVVPDPDVATTAARTLARARQPYRRLWVTATGAAVALAATGLLLLLIAAAFSPGVRHWAWPRDLARAATWTSSSALPGTLTSGTAPLRADTFFFHTLDEDHPWLRIELPSVARVRKVRVWARTDCCTERTIPLNIEVPEGDGWRLICQRRVPFASWTCDAGGVRTQVVRLRLAAHNMLHLSRVQIFE